MSVYDTIRNDTLLAAITPAHSAGSARPGEELGDCRQTSGTAKGKLGAARYAMRHISGAAGLSVHLLLHNIARRPKRCVTLLMECPCVIFGHYAALCQHVMGRPGFLSASRCRPIL